MSPNTAYFLPSAIAVPILAWFDGAVRLISSSSQVPVLAIATGPGFLVFRTSSSQHLIVVAAVVVGIHGLVHHVAARSSALLRTAETICHGGTASPDGFEIMMAPPESSFLMTCSS